MDMTDQALLREFAVQRCEESFRRLVDRHLRMVFSVANRVTGDQQLAEEIAQTTFATLATKADRIEPTEALAGWLYHTARHLALRAIRSEQRRRQREQISVTMNTDEPDPGVVAEHLETAMDQLKPEDRDALVLRFFEERNLREVGHELGLSEDAARMRVNRSLEKLRGIFGKLGITGTTAWLATTLPTSATAAVAVPTGLGASITSAVLGGTAVAATAAIVTQTTSSTMTLFNLKTAAAVIAAAAVTGTSTYLVKENEADNLRADNQKLQEIYASLPMEQQKAVDTIRSRNAQIDMLKKDVADLPRLRGEVDRLNRKLAELTTVGKANEALRDKLKLAEDLLNNTKLPPELIEQIKDLDRLGIAEQDARLFGLQNLGRALVKYASEHDGATPQDLSTLDYYRGNLPQDMELVYRGSFHDIKYPDRTILARTAQVRMAFDGTVMRSYVLADGVAMSQGAKSVKELDAWEMAFTNFTPDPQFTAAEE